jgi:hypothetical protein
MIAVSELNLISSLAAFVCMDAVEYLVVSVDHRLHLADADALDNDLSLFTRSGST